MFILESGVWFWEMCSVGKWGRLFCFVWFYVSYVCVCVIFLDDSLCFVGKVWFLRLVLFCCSVFFSVGVMWLNMFFVLFSISMWWFDSVFLGSGGGFFSI